MIGFLIELAWKSALCAGLTIGLLRLFRTWSAAEQSLVASIGLFALLLLPLAVLGLPEIEIAAPAPVMEAVAGLSADPAPVLEQGGPQLSGAMSFDWERLAAGLYLLPAAGLLLLLLLGVLRLQHIRRRANVLMDTRWLTALAAAQERFGLKHGTALLSSGELSSPISWGVVRPIIIIDPLAAESVDQAEAIIAHELAHVDRMDWLKLLFGRLATALLWFNPLVWVLARRSYQLCEEAADDAVLRGKVNQADYAQLLVKAVRHANGSACSRPTVLLLPGALLRNGSTTFLTVTSRGPPRGPRGLQYCFLPPSS